MNLELWRYMLTGMLLADDEGGSVAMVELLAQSVLENDGEYDPACSLSKYLDWFEEYEVDEELVGSTTARVLQRFLVTLSSNGSIRHEQLDVFGDSLFDTAEQIHHESKSAMADATVISRCLALSMLSHHLSIDQLATVARTESRLTHASKICQQSCAASVLIAAQLLAGRCWADSVKCASEHVKFTFPVKNALEEGMHPDCHYKDLSRGGYCTDVLKATVYFLSTSQSFSEALDRSRKFAFPSNYCPILVGAFGGLVYRDETLQMAQLSPRYCIRENISRIFETLQQLYNVMIQKPKCY